jgi:hypothetical protein
MPGKGQDDPSYQQQKPILVQYEMGTDRPACEGSKEVKIVGKKSAVVISRIKFIRQVN